MSDESAQPVLALVRDLIFASRIAATGRAVGVAVTLMRDPAQLAGRAGGRLVVDLNLDGAIDAAGAWARAAGGEVIGFVSHVDVETINRARAAGIANVLARSRFVERLPDLLAGRGAAGAAPPGPGGG